jgi:hypothetical protein
MRLASLVPEDKSGSRGGYPPRRLLLLLPLLLTTVSLCSLKKKKKLEFFFPSRPRTELFRAEKEEERKT